MAFKKDTKIKSNFQKITIGLASPEEILENSFGEVTKPETINFCSASASSVLPRTMSVPAVSTSASVIRVSSATVVV